MRRHGVPCCSRVQLCQTKLQLAGAFLQHVVHNELIHRAVVALFQRANGTPYGSLQRTFTSVEGNPLRLVVLVGSSAVQIELGWFLGILRTEKYLFVHVLVLTDMSATDIESFLRRKCILLTVNDYHAVALAAVHHAELTVVKEILVLDSRVYIESELEEVLQFQCLCDRHCAAKDKAVVVRVGKMNLVGLHHLLHHKTLTQRLGVVVLHILRMTGRLEFHVLLSTYGECAQHESHC